MALDEKKIDQAVLALLSLGLHDGARAWKGFDWEVMNRLHEKGFISDPRSKAKSVVFTEEGLAEARRLLEHLFSVSSTDRKKCAEVGEGAQAEAEGLGEEQKRDTPVQP